MRRSRSSSRSTSRCRCRGKRIGVGRIVIGVHIGEGTGRRGSTSMSRVALEEKKEEVWGEFKG